MKWILILLGSVLNLCSSYWMQINNCDIDADCFPHEVCARGTCVRIRDPSPLDYEEEIDKKIYHNENEGVSIQTRSLDDYRDELLGEKSPSNSDPSGDPPRIIKFPVGHLFPFYLPLRPQRTAQKPYPYLDKRVLEMPFIFP